MNTYAEARDNEQLRLLIPAIDAFIEAGRSRETLFFFPGGMASRLVRATRPFTGEPQLFDYEPIWLTPNALLFGEARELAMRRDQDRVFRDVDNRFVLADGTVSVFGCTPHAHFVDWCAQHDINLFVFGWDWRRRLDETVTFFVNTFLPFFQARVLAAGRSDPLASFSIVGHSFGGLLVNLVLRLDTALTARIRCAITVAAPFYGTASQIHRWFEGESYCNGLFPPYPYKQVMLETIASLPSLYALHFPEERHYPADLSTYPSVDATIPTRRADPYHPQMNGSRVRYPMRTGFDYAELEYARQQVAAMLAPMPPEKMRRFFNLYGVRTQADQQTPVFDTPGHVAWDWIDPSFDATHQSPIVDRGVVSGDDTQPAWGAYLATNATRCIALKAHDIRHMFLMNHPQTLNALSMIYGVPSTETPPDASPQPASDEEVVEFLRWLFHHRERVQHCRQFDDEVRTLVPAVFQDALLHIGGRMLMDIMKRPGPSAFSERPASAPLTHREPIVRYLPRRKADSSACPWPVTWPIWPTPSAGWAGWPRRRGHASGPWS